MKSLAITLYVSIVLMISMTARAADFTMPFSKGETDAQIKVLDVYFDELNLELDIAGRLANPCIENPEIVLLPDANEPNTLILTFSSPRPTEACVLPVGGFHTLVNLPVVAQSTDLALDPEALYLIKLEGHDFEKVVSGADLMRVPGFVGQ